MKHVSITGQQNCIELNRLTISRRSNIRWETASLIPKNRLKSLYSVFPFGHMIHSPRNSYQVQSSLGIF